MGVNEIPLNLTSFIFNQFSHCLLSASSWQMVPAASSRAEVNERRSNKFIPFNMIYYWDLCWFLKYFLIQWFMSAILDSHYLFVSSIHLSNIILCNVFDCHWSFSLFYILFMHKYDKPFNRMIFSCKIVASANISFHLLLSSVLRHFA